MHMMRGRNRRALMRGLSLVELMVGVTVSLFIVAAAALLVSSQLTDNRRLLLETQLQQDLRATADIITRELRRSSYWADARSGVPAPVGSLAGQVAPNPTVALAVSTPASSTVHYKYNRASGSQAFGFRLNSDGVVVACQSDGTAAGAGGLCGDAPNVGGDRWQELSDRNTVRITAFRIDQRVGNAANDDAMTLPCPFPCADGTGDCWPKVSVRELTIVITGQSRNQPNVQRTLSSSVRVRNDQVQLSGEAPPLQACPAG